MRRLEGNAAGMTAQRTLPTCRLSTVGLRFLSKVMVLETANAGCCTEMELIGEGGIWVA